MSNYMDLVVIENPHTTARFICRAPWLSHLERGTQVVYQLDGSRAKYDGIVIATMDIGKDEEEDIKFILECNDQVEIGLPKIISKIKSIDFEYKDE